MPVYLPGSVADAPKGCVSNDRLTTLLLLLQALLEYGKTQTLQDQGL